MLRKSNGVEEEEVWWKERYGMLRSTAVGSRSHLGGRKKRRKLNKRIRLMVV